MRRRVLPVLPALLALLAMPAPAAPAPEAAALGEQLYREGRRADGAPLQALREHGLTVSGRDAACIQCHRASGMGGAEGSSRVPPIVGARLDAPGQAGPGTRARVAPGLQRQPPGGEQRPAYDREHLARALTAGIDAGGRAMDALMPRYRLDAAEVAALDAYLHTLTVGAAPGFDGRVLHLATIVGADTAPEVQEAGAGVLAACLAERSPRVGAEAGTGAPPWVLHRWTLGADPARWSAELQALQQAQPVFALISGLTGPDGRGAWQPVQQHCEREGLPCLLPQGPSIDDRQPLRWTLAFNRGVSLEASGLAQALGEPDEDGRAPPRRLHQIVQGRDEASRLGAARLAERLAAAGAPVHVEPPIDLDAPGPGAAAAMAALRTATPDEAWVLWLDGAALARLAALGTPAPQARVALSGERLAGRFEAVPPAWRANVRLTWLWDRPGRTRARLALNAGRWLLSHERAPAADPALLQIQAHAYSACELAASALRRMGREVGRAHFMERIEEAEEAATATALPRFTLGTNRREASSMLWRLRFEPGRDEPVPDGEPLSPP